MHLQVKHIEYSPINLGEYLAQQVFGAVAMVPMAYVSNTDSMVILHH